MTWSAALTLATLCCALYQPTAYTSLALSMTALQLGEEHECIG